MNQKIIDVIDKLEAFQSTVDDALALPRESAAFAHTLILSTGARRGLEIGTSYGFSGLWIGSALVQNGGNLITLDRDPRKSEAARSHFASAGLDAAIDARTGAAADIIASLEGPFDFVLNDADKENCLRYVELLDGKLTDRAVVLTDNTISHAAELEGFVKWIRAREDFYSVGLTIGSGMELSVKRSAP